jgi:hypothetical protein
LIYVLINVSKTIHLNIHKYANNWTEGKLASLGGDGMHSKNPTSLFPSTNTIHRTYLYNLLLHRFCTQR